ncbi:hypothetical protein ACFFRR_006513 [Megaselia abdita]
MILIGIIITSLTKTALSLNLLGSFLSPLNNDFSSTIFGLNGNDFQNQMKHFQHECKIKSSGDNIQQIHSSIEIILSRLPRIVDQFSVCCSTDDAGKMSQYFSNFNKLLDCLTSDLENGNNALFFKPCYKLSFQL